jgi:hypothetical protein
VSHRVFISHASEDRLCAGAVCTYLEGNSVPCWLAPRNIQTGEIWATSIVNAINASSVFVILCSRHAMSSLQVQRELERAGSKAMPLVPLRLENIPLSGAFEFFLSNAHWLDLFPAEPEEYFPALRNAVLQHLGVAAPIENPKPVPRDAETTHPDQWTRGGRPSFFGRMASMFDDREN